MPSRRIVVVALTLLGAVLAGCGGGAASPTKVAQVAGASYCDNSGYFIQSKLTSSKETIYDCRFGRRLPECVTYSGNIATNSTSDVQFLFVDALNAKRPECLTWLKTARARLARIAARKRAERAAARLRLKKQTYEAILKGDRISGWHDGFTAWNGNAFAYQAPTIYYRWLNDRACPQYDQDGCYHVEIVTRNGCSGVDVTISETPSQSASSPQIGSVDGYTDGLQAQQPAIIEIDADQADAKYGQVTSIGCY
jgi:hypothetical protein